MASLLAELQESGSRKSDGTANDSGLVWAFIPGTTSPATLYTDADLTAIATQPVVLDEGGRVPRADYPDGLWVTTKIRLYVEASDTTVVSDTTYTPADAGNTAVENDGFTGDTLDEVLTAAKTSFGGDDFKYLIALGQTERNYSDVISEIHASVKAFGAKGDGIATDTTSVQNTINFVKAAGGGVVYFPPGTYKIDQALTLTGVNGVTFRGAGIAATVITSSHATADAFTVSTCNSLLFEGFRVSHSATSTGKAFSLTTCVRPTFLRVETGDASDSGVHRYGIYATTCSGLAIRDCHVFAIAADAAARGVYANNCGGISTIGGTIQAIAGYAMEFDGDTYCASFSTVMGASLRFAATLTGIYFTFVGSSITTLSVATATIPFIRMIGAGIDASATSGAVGAAQTPSLIAGNEVILSATSGGAGIVTVNSPAILPGTGASNGVDLYWNFVFKNASGGAVTWTLNAVFVTASAIPTTDGHTIGVRFRWDRATSKLREVSRADTVT